MAKILVVDDSPTVVAFLSAILGPEGHTVDTLQNFVELPIYLRRARPDLVVLDLHMPTMSGVAFGRFIRQQQHARIPIVVYSSAPVAEREEAAKTLENAYTIAKGESPTAINRLVTKLLERSATVSRLSPKPS